MEALRQIPPINDVLESPLLEPFRALLQTPFGSRILNDVLSETRRELTAEGTVIGRPELTFRIAERIAIRIQESLKPSLRRVINASGVILHTNLGRAPLPASAIEHLRDVATHYSNLEFDVAHAARGKRDTHISRVICDLLNCEAAIVVNNNAAAVLLVLNTLGEGGEVIASRGEQVEIGGSFRIPEVMTKSGARLREVGTTNRTRIRDYENAINDNTRLLLRVHPSNFKMLGFTEKPSLQEFVDLGQRKNIPTFEDIGSGCLLDDISALAGGEPLAAESIRAGVDVICFSGDKLLGGPQAGIIAGKKLFVEKIRQNPLFRALRVDKLTIAALESVLTSYLKGATDEIPIWHMLHLSEKELQKRAVAFAEKSGTLAKPLSLRSVIGGGSAPETYLPSWGIAVQIRELSETEIERRLRLSEPPIIVRIEEGRVVLDLRTVFEDEEETLLAALKSL
jgi:L-seryl-tRNA(Ser) seleniumtransferase